jgi:nickel-dependent lactate racemase
MIGSVLQHSEKHLLEAYALCALVSEGEGLLQERLKQVLDLKAEITVIRDDMTRALLFFGIDDMDFEQLPEDKEFAHDNA